MAFDYREFRSGLCHMSDVQLHTVLCEAQVEFNKRAEIAIMQMYRNAGIRPGDETISVSDWVKTLLSKEGFSNFNQEMKDSYRAWLSSLPKGAVTDRSDW